VRQYTSKEFIKIVKKNGFVLNRYNGDHAIFVNDKGRHISIPKNLECVIARRLIKENNLDINIKRKNKMKESGGYPAGAEFDKNAPYNEEIPIMVDVEVFVSLTMSKTFILKVPKEDIDNNNVDKYKLVSDNIILPNNAALHLSSKLSKESKDKLMADISEWDIDDSEVLID